MKDSQAHRRQAARLVNTGKMMMAQTFDHDALQGLVDAWLTYHRILESTGDMTGQTDVADPYLWAIERLDDLCRAQPELCWHLILEIFALTESDFQRAALAAGALEDLLNRYGSDFIDRIEGVAEKNEKFRELLTGIWRNTIDEAVWNRIQNARGQPA